MNDRTYRKSRRELLFADLASPEELAQVLSQADTRTFKRGDTLFVEGESSNSLYVIVEGSVEFTTRERAVRLDEQFAGEYFGEVSLYDSSPRSATATATRDTVCRVIPQELLFRWLNANPKVSIALLRHAAYRIRDLSAEVRASAYQRVTDYIERNAVYDGEVRVIHAMPSIVRLADMLDISRKYTTTILSELRERKCITLEGGRLTVWKPLPKSF
jgi:CRP/FNR family transcriptional regulator, cyclic AMP receptor protein